MIVDAVDDSNSETNSCKVSISSPRSMLRALFSLVFCSSDVGSGAAVAAGLVSVLR